MGKGIEKVLKINFFLDILLFGLFLVLELSFFLQFKKLGYCILLLCLGFILGKIIRGDWVEIKSLMFLFKFCFGVRVFLFYLEF